MASNPHSGGAVMDHPIAKNIGGPKRPVTGGRSGSVGCGEYARTRCLPGLQAPPSSARAGRCRRAVPEAEVDAILNDLAVGHGDKQPVRPGAGGRTQCNVAILGRLMWPTECVDVCGVDTDFVERHGHRANSFFSTLPIALRGRLSTSRTSRGRLCTESCCATNSINACGSASPTTKATIR